MKIIFVNRFFHPDLAPTGLHAADVAFEREWNEPIALERWREVIARVHKSEQA